MLMNLSGEHCTEIIVLVLDFYIEIDVANNKGLDFSDVFFFLWQWTEERIRD